MYGGERQTSGNDETKPFFWSKLYYDPKKKAGRSPALDRLLYNESTEAFFWSEQRYKKKHNFVWIIT
jgi:hypothetical protein